MLVSANGSSFPSDKKWKDAARMILPRSEKKYEKKKWLNTFDME